jgi:hypothetical protein
MYKPFWCSICICSFVDLQQFDIISHTITTQAQYFCFMLYVYSLSPHSSNIIPFIILATPYYRHMKNVVLQNLS